MIFFFSQQNSSWLDDPTGVYMIAGWQTNKETVRFNHFSLWVAWGGITSPSPPPTCRWWRRRLSGDPLQLKTPPAAIINNKHCGRRWQMVAKCLCCQIYQLEQKISICSSETEALPETTGSWNAPLGRVQAAAVTRFCTADSCLTFSRTAAGNEIFKSPRRGKQNTKHSPSPSPEPDPGSVRTQETRQPSVTSSWAISYTLTTRPVWWHCRTTQFCSAAGPRKRPGGLAGSDLQLHQEMDSDGINLGAETLI